MAYLNLKAEGIEVKVDASREEKVSISIGSLPSKVRATLSEEIAGIVALGDGEIHQELRIDFTDTLTLFIKRREGGSRMLVAHPETGYWVGTLAITRTHGEVLASALNVTSFVEKDDQRVGVHQLEKVDRASNLELYFQ
jgi:hypothetical protein